VSDPELITLTIDGKTVTASKGTSVLEAAKILGIRIPHYCYHPGLSVVGSCRMCLVEIENNPKLQPSCAMPIASGMVVRTETPEAVRNRKSVLEFLLLNHPLDCPVCDQAGECELQNYYMEYGLYEARFNEDKTKRKKACPIGPRVILDQERCILCTRCVRFTREISRTGELGVIKRAHKSEIDLFPGIELDNPYSANVADICPVGALTDRDFRFQCRVWFLDRAPSICPGCSRGCNIEVHYNKRFNPRYHDARIHRLKPRFNPEVNRYWMCDEGRYAYHGIDAPDRLKSPRIRNEGGHVDATWEEVIGKTAAALEEAIGKYGSRSVGLLASPQMTNEELFVLRRLFVDLLKVEAVEYCVAPKEKAYADDFLVTEDRNPNSRGAEVLGFGGKGCDALLDACARGDIRFLYLCHHDLTNRYDPSLVNAALGEVDFIVYQGSRDHATASLADVQLPGAVYAEKDGTFTNMQGRVQRIHAAVSPLGESLPDLDILTRLAAAMGVQMPPTLPGDVFEEIGREVEAFAGLTYESVGDTGQLLKDTGTRYVD
jgi:NADH-quinone oxidoreductase subunit G